MAALRAAKNLVHVVIMKHLKDQFMMSEKQVEQVWGDPENSENAAELLGIDLRFIIH